MYYEPRLHFGKYKGEHVANLPRSYLRWLLAECEGLDPDLRYAVKAELQCRGTRLLPADQVLAAVENELEARVSEDCDLDHDAAARLCDHVMGAFDAVRQRFRGRQQNRAGGRWPEVRADTPPWQKEPEEAA